MLSGGGSGNISNRKNPVLAPFNHPNHHTSIVKQLLLRRQYEGLFKEGNEQLHWEDSVVDGVEELEDERVGIWKGTNGARV